jgi:hypothetical protein
MNGHEREFLISVTLRVRKLLLRHLPGYFASLFGLNSYLAMACGGSHFQEYKSGTL